MYGDPTSLIKDLRKADVIKLPQSACELVACIGAGEFGEVFHATIEFPEGKVSDMTQGCPFVYDT